MDVIKVNRRDFVKITSVASAGLLLGVRAHADEKTPSALGAFVEIGTDGYVTIYVPKSEMGQGVRTAIPMMVAEELDADWNNVRIRQADLNPKYGRQGTGGSGSIRSTWMPMRRAGAAARAMLVAAAAKKWAVDPASVNVSKGVVTSGSHKATFAELAPDAAKLDVPKDVTLKDPSKFTIIGKNTHRLDTPDLIRGKSQYGIDVKVPGMLYAAVAHPPVFGATVASYDDTKAKAVPGVVAVVKTEPRKKEAPWSGVGVVAKSTWAAIKGRDALSIKWDEGAAKSESTDALFVQMRDLANKPGEKVRARGDVDAALASASKKIDSTFELPYLAHATMEPMNATASVTSDGIEIWGPTQFPDWWGGWAAGAVGLKSEQAKVHVTLLGGGFGRRAFPDVAVEAAQLSKAVGKPVKVQWTREDDIQHDFYRPAAVHRIIASIDDNGKITAWQHRMVHTSISSYLERGGNAGEDEAYDDFQFPSSVPSFRLEFADAKSAVPRGWWRSVENTMHAFTVASMFDELAHAAGKDPIEFHLAQLTPGYKFERKELPGMPYEDDRMRRVIETVRDRSNWGKTQPLRAQGFAAWYSFATYVAEVAEVSVDKDRNPRVDRVVVAIDCGQAVNPDGVAAQAEGAIVYGLTAALQGAITIKNGAVEQSNFHDYPLMTIEQMPVVEVHIVPSTAPPTGMGEPATPPIAPAVANALFALTGKRLRKLPFVVSS